MTWAAGLRFLRLDLDDFDECSIAALQRSMEHELCRRLFGSRAAVEVARLDRDAQLRAICAALRMGTERLNVMHRGAVGDTYNYEWVCGELDGPMYSILFSAKRDLWQSHRGARHFDMVRVVE